MAKQQSPIITDKAQLIGWFEAGGKGQDNWKIGTEHEKFVFAQNGFYRPTYEGEAGIGALLQHLATTHGWQALYEGDNIIAMGDGEGGSITLEPGGQIELSGAPLDNLHQTCAEAGRHLHAMKTADDRFGLGMIGLGFDPLWGRADIPWMPKGRYKIMRQYMPKVGSLGLDMMQRTCTIQVNLDYADEGDMVRKFRTALALQPIATALFANSPFREGKPTGLLSTRAEVWTDTDNARCGVPACVFDDGFGFEQWVDYLLDVPMYFLHEGDGYIDVAGRSFRDFMAGRLEGHYGRLPTIADWADHVTTAFPEVRLKTYLEMRGADGGPWDMICTLPALWVGVLYDADALLAAEELAEGLGAEAVAEARLAVARAGLNAQIGGRPVLDIARRMVAIAGEGLGRRNRLNTSGDDETGYLDPIRHIAASGETRAEKLLRHYQGDWGGRLEPLYRQCQF